MKHSAPKGTNMPEAQQIPPFPARLTVELTNRCNLSCLFCPRQSVHMEPGDMPLELFRKIALEAAAHRPVALALFFRGESLLHPQLEEMIRLAKSLGLGPLQLASNGLMLERDRADGLAESGLDFISFSLDTLDAGLYRRSRRGGELKDAAENIAAFIEIVKDRRLRGLGAPEVQISAVETEEHRPGMEGFVNFWREKADIVRVYVEHSADGHSGSLKGARKGQRRPCRKLLTDLVIYHDGTAALCNHDWDNKQGLGSVKDSTIAEIWNSPAYNALRRADEAGRPPESSACFHCDHWRMYYNEDGFLGRIYRSGEFS
ncbi:molybdenum cofactor biosynthesis protein (plasmid) [Deltaproteobacteria bacterium Smac51]|nr:molybdenum cofactor biosynthesis protein [Deltaproteobacteria bacterium Smac51]